MQIEIDISRVEEHARTALVVSSLLSELIDGSKSIQDKIVINVSDGKSRDDIQQLVKKVFIENNLNDYNITESADNDFEIIILRRGDLQQIGLFPCLHCGMMFKSEVERSEHEKIHYFI